MTWAKTLTTMICTINACDTDNPALHHRPERAGRRRHRVRSNLCSEIEFALSRLLLRKSVGISDKALISTSDILVEHGIRNISVNQNMRYAASLDLADLHPPREDFSARGLRVCSKGIRHLCLASVFSSES